MYIFVSESSESALTERFGLNFEVFRKMQNGLLINNVQHYSNVSKVKLTVNLFRKKGPGGEKQKEQHKLVTVTYRIIVPFPASKISDKKMEP